MCLTFCFLYHKGKQKISNFQKKFTEMQSFQTMDLFESNNFIRRWEFEVPLDGQISEVRMKKMKLPKLTYQNFI